MPIGRFLLTAVIKTEVKRRQLDCKEAPLGPACMVVDNNIFVPPPYKLFKAVKTKGLGNRQKALISAVKEQVSNTNKAYTEAIADVDIAPLVDKVISNREGKK